MERDKNYGQMVHILMVISEKGKKKAKVFFNGQMNANIMVTG